MTAPVVEHARLRFDEVGAALTVSVGGVAPAVAAVARALPTEDGRLGIVLADPGLVFHPEFAFRLRRWVPARGESVRLVVPRGACADRWNRVPAQELCEQLDVDVLAADGEIVAVPGGTLFVHSGSPGPAGATGGRWWRHRPGREPLAGARRHPLPGWERELAALTETPLDIAPDLTVEQVPAGLWVRWRDSPGGPITPDDRAYAIAAHDENLTLLVSRPGDPPLRAADLRRIVESMPASIRERLVATPYGDRPVADGELGAVVSAAANRSLRVRTGLPLQLAGQGTQTATVDHTGRPTWMPFATQLAWRPHGGARILAWLTPADGLLPAGQGQFLLSERWLVEVIEAGLWIRPAEKIEGAGAVRRLPLEAEHCTVVIGSADADQPVPPWRSVERLLHRLPGPAQDRLRLAVPTAAGEWFADAVARACKRLLAGAALLRVTGSGVLAGVPRSDRPAAPLPTERPVYRPAHVKTDETAEAPARRTESRRVRSEADEVGALLHYVDEIRRTPAWDEPARLEPTTAPATKPTTAPAATRTPEETP